MAAGTAAEKKQTRYILTLGRRDISWSYQTRYIATLEDTMSSNTSWGTRGTSQATVRTWIRTPFGQRDERSRPTRPYVDHGHGVARQQPPPLV
jgi:hypothetical protein